MKAQDISLTSPDELMAFAERYGKSHHKFLLYGNHGAGKTTFVRGFAKAIGIDPGVVRSPSDSFTNIYDSKLLHVDMRRLDTLEKAEEIGLRDLINDHEYIALERPKREDNYKDDSRISLTFKDDELSGRSIHVQ